ncbi:MAG: hypothetical protein WC144_08450 [Sulfurimonas sp.]
MKRKELKGLDETISLIHSKNGIVGWIYPSDPSIPPWWMDGSDGDGCCFYSILFKSDAKFASDGFLYAVFPSGNPDFL